MIPTLSQVCCLSSPFDRDLEDFAGAGYSSVEVWLTKLEKHLESHSAAAGFACDRATTAPT